MTGYLIINPRSGDDSPTPEELAAAAEERGIRWHILAEDDDPVALAGSSDADALGVAGGDGSLAAIAAVALDRDLPFVCIPFGTRNHFARDVGLDRNDPLGMLAAFEGTERRIDVGRVNGRLFLNNLSLGLYAGLIVRRERHRRRSELFAGARALARLAREPHRLHARVNGEPLEARVLLIANNCFELSLFNLGERPRLDEGELHLFCAGGWLPTSWADHTAARFRIEFDGTSVVAAADGEPLTLEPPLDVECLAEALRLLLP